MQAHETAADTTLHVPPNWQGLLSQTVSANIHADLKQNLNCLAFERTALGICVIVRFASTSLTLCLWNNRHFRVNFRYMHHCEIYLHGTLYNTEIRYGAHVYGIELWTKIVSVTKS